MKREAGKGALGSIRNAAIAVADNKICWVGATQDAPEGLTVIDASDQIVMPGLIDCHTHTAWAGSRAQEFEARLNGASYTEILKNGGGILHTVEKTRAMSLEELTQLTKQRLQDSQLRGVTTTEIKSGYGLTPEHELKQLKAAKEAGRLVNVRVLTTFLGAHTVPKLYRQQREQYVDQIINKQIPLIAQHADFIDAYIDSGAFTVDEGRRIFQAGIQHGLKPKVHAEQVTYTGAAALAAEMNAVSADHLERLDDKGAIAMANANVTAVLLPGAMLYLKDTPPPIQLLRDHGIKIAVATDYNPGSSPLADLWTAATLAVLQMGLTVDEALLGITKNAALALNLPNLGVIEVGATADIIAVAPPTGEPTEAASLIQFMGPKYPSTVIVNGQVITA